MTREQTIHRIKLSEGFRSLAYLCTENKWTIGYGRNLEDNPLNPSEQIRIFGTANNNAVEYFKTHHISEKDAEYLLSNDINKILRQLDSKIYCFHNYPTNVISVLIDMAYNIGVANLMKFKATLYYLADGQWVKASEEMLKSDWAEQVPNRAKKLSEIIFNTQNYE